MEKRTSIGKLARAPLVYTAASVAIQLENFPKYIAELHDALRNEYPTIAEMKATVTSSEMSSIGPDISVNETHFRAFNNPSRDWGVVFGKDFILFHTTANDRYNTFSQRFENILTVFKEKTNLAFCYGVSFRQIDNISAVDNEKKLEDFIKSKYLPLDIFHDPDQKRRMRQEQSFILGSDRVFSRTYAFPDDLGIKLPRNLVPFFSVLRMDPQEPLMRMQPPYMMADFEAVSIDRKNPIPFTPTDLCNKLKVLHDSTSEAFSDLMTTEAIERRREERVDEKK